LTNTALLESYISESGLKVGYICEKLGLSRQGFRKKLTNESEFKASEINALAALLGISVTERDSIFFAEKGD
jgi:hypothetical protein